MLHCKLHSLRLKEGELIQEHIKIITKIFNELAPIEAPMDEEDRGIQLLASLPESYDTLVTGLEANEKVPSMKTVIERLLYEERKAKAQTEIEGEVLTVKSKVKWKRGIRCHNCRKLGHIQMDCYERGERKSERSRKSQKRNSAKKNNKDSTRIGLLASAHALAADSDSQRNNWIIDSSATCHISNCNKTMFNKKRIWIYRRLLH